MALSDFKILVEQVCPACHGKDGYVQHGNTIQLNNGCPTCRGRLTIQKNISLVDLKNLLDGYV